MFLRRRRDERAGRRRRGRWRRERQALVVVGGAVGVGRTGWVGDGVESYMCRSGGFGIVEVREGGGEVVAGEGVLRMMVLVMVMAWVGAEEGSFAQRRLPSAAGLFGWRRV